MEAYLPLLTWQFPSTSCCVHGSRTALFLLGGEYRCSSSNLKLSPFFLNSCCHSLQWAEEKVERIWSPGSIAQPYCSLSNHFPVSEIMFSALHTHFSVLLLFFSPPTFPGESSDFHFMACLPLILFCSLSFPPRETITSDPPVGGDLG